MNVAHADGMRTLHSGTLGPIIKHPHFLNFANVHPEFKLNEFLNATYVQSERASENVCMCTPPSFLPPPIQSIGRTTEHFKGCTPG